MKPFFPIPGRNSVRFAFPFALPLSLLMSSGSFRSRDGSVYFSKRKYRPFVLKNSEDVCLISSSGNLSKISCLVPFRGILDSR